MRYSIILFLIFFTQYAYSDHGIRATGIVVVSSGETKSACVVGDQRPQCCVVPKRDYACSSRLTSACCGSHSDCHWSPVGGTNTCHAVSSLCDVTNSNNTRSGCLLTTGHYTSPERIPGVCRSGYTGNCSYFCNSGTIAPSMNSCIRKCSAQTISGCVLPSGTTGQRAGACNTDTGTCRRTCENGQWKQKSSDYTSCRNWRNCYHGNSLCSYRSLNHGWTRSYGCKTNYTGNCTYSCNDRTMTITNTCRRKQCSSTTISNCRLSAINTGSTRTGTCNTGWTGSGTSCRYACNSNQTWSSRTACTRLRTCPATAWKVRNSYYEAIGTCNLKEEQVGTGILCVVGSAYIMQHHTNLIAMDNIDVIITGAYCQSTGVWRYNYLLHIFRDNNYYPSSWPSGFADRSTRPMWWINPLFRVRNEDRNTGRSVILKHYNGRFTRY